MMISRELEVTLGLALREAVRRQHEYLTLEHVLYALLHDTDVAEVLRNCGDSWRAIASTVATFVSAISCV